MSMGYTGKISAEFNAIHVTTPRGCSGGLDTQTVSHEENAEGLVSGENEGDSYFQHLENSLSQTGPKTQKDTHFTPFM